MKCPVCIQEGKKSRVSDKGSAATLISCPSYYDEDGKQHHHDRNTTTASYSCSNGHNFMVGRVGRPCWCGWNKDQVPTVTINELGLDRRFSPRVVVGDPKVLKAMTEDGTDG